MKAINIDEMLNERIQEYEEIEPSFNKIMLAKMYNRKLVVIYNNARKLDFLKRYLSEIDMNISHSIKIEDIFFIHREMDTIHEIEKYASDEQYIVISMIDFSHCWWNKIIKKIKRPYYFLLFPQYSRIKTTLNSIDYFEPSFYRERGQNLFDYVKNNKEKIEDLYVSLADDISRDTLSEVIRVGILNRAWSIPQGSQFDKYWDCYNHLDDECWVNCGSASGDTIVKYLYKGFKFSKIYAYEGEANVFKELKKVMSFVPDDICKKIDFVNSFIGINDSSDNFNHIFNDKRVTLINMDIEGAEMAVLRGISELIRKQRPVLAICAYHKSEDLLDIPQFINDNVENYKIFLRKYIGGMPHALNEFVYYCVPNERCIND